MQKPNSGCTNGVACFFMQKKIIKIRKEMKKKIGREMVFFIFFSSIKNQEFSFQAPEKLLPICHVFYIGAEIYYERFSLHINKCGGGNIEHH